MPNPLPSSGQNGRALLISPDLAAASELAMVLSARMPGVAIEAQHTYPAGIGLSRLLSDGSLQLCFLDTSGRASAFRVISEISERRPELPVVALLPNEDPDLILGCLRQGASEFMVRPFTDDQLRTVLGKLSRLLLLPEPAGTAGRVYCVIPAKGSSGATTVACNLAYSLKRLAKGKVLLADLDPLAGTVGFLLKLKSTYSFADALAHDDRLDPDLWKALVEPWNGIDALLAPEMPAGGLTESHAPAALMEYCRQNYDYVVTDANSVYGEWNLGLAHSANEVLLMTTNELAVLRAGQRALTYLEEHGIHRAKVRVVLNHCQTAYGLEQKDVCSALRSEIFHVCPTGGETLRRSIMEGKPAAPGSPFGKSIAALARLISGCEPHQRTSPLAASVNALFGRS